MALAYLAELNLRLDDVAEAERLVARADTIGLSADDDTGALDHVRQLIIERHHAS